jgi:hypothetical protein
MQNDFNFWVSWLEIDIEGPQILAQLTKCWNCYVERRDQNSNSDSSTYVNEFLMAIIISSGRINVLDLRKSEHGN